MWSRVTLSVIRMLGTKILREALQVIAGSWNWIKLRLMNNRKLIFFNNSHWEKHALFLTQLPNLFGLTNTFWLNSPVFYLQSTRFTVIKIQLRDSMSVTALIISQIYFSTFRSMLKNNIEYCHSIMLKSSRIIIRIIDVFC